MSALSSMKVTELVALAKERGVRGYSGKKKAELIAMLSDPAPAKTQKVTRVKRKLRTVPRGDFDGQGVVDGMDDDDILSAKYWKNTRTYRSITETKETQLQYYMRMGSCDEVRQLVELNSKSFGTVSEKIIQDIFKLGPRTSPQNDGTRHGKKAEIKSARYWACQDDCVWQHLEPDHDYEYVLFALLDFHGWKVWGIKKSLLMGELREKKIVTSQGEQGYWVKKSAILPYLTSIKTIADLDAFIQS